MKLLEVWKRIGKQRLKLTRTTDAMVFIDGNKYKISKAKYDKGVLIGFTAEPKEYEWFDKRIKPEEGRWIIVKGKDGKEYIDHQWVGHAWFEFVRYDNAVCDGYLSDVDIVSWRYEDE